MSKMKAEIKIMVIPEPKAPETTYNRRVQETPVEEYRESKFTLYADSREDLESKLQAISKLV